VKKWGDLNGSEKAKWLSIGVIIVFVIFAGLGTMALVNRPAGYVPEKDTQPVFGQEER
jgi:hypothetical protein